MRRPIDPPVHITGDRATHAVYGVGPATDYAVPVGTPVLAPFPGQLTKYTTSAGGIGVILRGAEAAFYGQHLWTRLADGHYAEGARIALSGNSGTQTTGPHLHCYVIVHATGERLSMEEYLTRAAGNGAQPFTPDEEDTMPHFHDPTHRIYWPNGFYSSYDAGVYNAVKAYFQRGEILPGTAGTVEREVWAANDYMAARSAAAVAKVVGAAGNTVDVSALAAKVVAALQKTFTVTAK